MALSVLGGRGYKGSQKLGLSEISICSEGWGWKVQPICIIAWFIPPSLPASLQSSQ